MTTIRYGQGAQTIRWVPIDDMGIPRRVSAATYSIVDLREAEDTSRRTVAASTSATASSVSTTTTAVAGPSTANPRLVSLTSLTGIRTGGAYMLSHGSAAVDETITVSRTITGALQVQTSRPLTRAFPSGSTFTGLELEATFPADVADDETRLDLGGGPFCVIWVYTIGEQRYVTPQDVWITRYGATPWVRPDQVYRYMPGLASSTGGESFDPEQAIMAATDDLFEALSSAATPLRDPSNFRGDASATAYVAKRAIVYLLRAARDADALALSQVYADEAKGHLNNLTTGRPPTRAVSVDPVDDVSVGRRRTVNRIFSRS